ncbi:MAG: hypothetical protein ACK4SZ_02090 [Allosphingosinicella sp.]|uniref:hypothetical protein n=1 Tax=Allosphingosinicella sp. TaxID=2823234 RepID=UPI003930F149
MITAYPVVGILIGLLLVGTGLYMRTAPRRLFTRPDDPSEYRPQATELDSEQGRWMTRTYPPILILAGLALIAFQIITLLSE